MVDSMTMNWVTLVERQEDGDEGFGWVVQWFVALFYADIGLLASYKPACLQAVIYVLTGIFDRFRIHTNFNKMMGMVC